VKIGLLIQGPIDSFGKNGKSIRYSPLQIAREPDSMVNFSAVQNIEKICERSKGIFCKTVVSTWKNENSKSIKFNADEIILLDNEEYFGAKTTLFSGPRNWNNILKQAKTTYEGTRVLKSLGCDYVIKTRTDMDLNLDLLHKAGSECFKQDKILATNKLRNGTRYLEMDDMVLGAEVDVMLNWFGSLLSWKFYNGAHSAVMRSLLFSLNMNNLNISPKDYYSATINEASPELSKEATHLWNKKFYTLPKELWETVIWRGEVVDKSYYDFNAQEVEINKNLPTTDVNLFLKEQIGANWFQLLIKSQIKKIINTFLQSKRRFKNYIKPITIFRIKKKLKKILLRKD
jgi:hypothetical protein